jgi:hypothetical protein
MSESVILWDKFFLLNKISFILFKIFLNNIFLIFFKYNLVGINFIKLS